MDLKAPSTGTGKKVGKNIRREEIDESNKAIGIADEVAKTR